MTTFQSDLSNEIFPISEKVPAKTIRPSIFNVIQKENPQFTRESSLSKSELKNYRKKAISNYIAKENGVLSESENTVLSSLVDNQTITDKIETEESQVLSVGQRVADKVAAFGGSWKFIIFFLVFIVIWVSSNIVFLYNEGFDPYPFILLNLLLSCIAALQAPVIMMSQNRQEEKDRERSRKDYMINLKSELEIRTLHEKVDHFIMDQQQELIEMQKTEIDMLKDILQQLEKKKDL